MDVSEISFDLEGMKSESKLISSSTSGCGDINIITQSVEEREFKNAQTDGVELLDEEMYDGIVDGCETPNEDSDNDDDDEGDVFNDEDTADSTINFPIIVNYMDENHIDVKEGNSNRDLNHSASTGDSSASSVSSPRGDDKELDHLDGAKIDYRPYIIEAFNQHRKICDLIMEDSTDVNHLSEFDFSFVGITKCKITPIPEVMTLSLISNNIIDEDPREKSEDFEGSTYTSFLSEVDEESVFDRRFSLASNASSSRSLSSNHSKTSSVGSYPLPCELREFPMKDQAPRIFHKFREMWGIEDRYYAQVLNSVEQLKQIGSAGKSGAFFFISQCDQFIVKTITKEDSVTLMNILPHYYNYQKRNTNTLLPRFFGLHHLRVNGNKIRFTVMQNVFYSHVELHERYDLKGSTHGRRISQKEKLKPGAIKKDLDVEKPFEIGSARKEQLIFQIKNDSNFLNDHGLMDYSFLVGVNDDPTEREENVPVICKIKHNHFLNKFQHACGGCPRVREKDGINETQRLNGCCYFGIIDILQVYNKRKLAESSLKKTVYSKQAISCVDSKTYAKRFVDYLEKIIT